MYGQRLREARKACGLTQKQLALAVNTTDDSIYSWEKGRRQPSVEQIRQLCKTLNVSADYLLGLED